MRLEDLGLERQMATEHEVVERVVSERLAFDGHSFPPLGDDAQRQRLDLLPRRADRRREPVDRQPGPVARVAALGGRARREFRNQVAGGDPVVD